MPDVDFSSTGIPDPVVITTTSINMPVQIAQVTINGPGGGGGGGGSVRPETGLLYPRGQG